MDLFKELRMFVLDWLGFVVIVCFTICVVFLL